ncbi:hypothetical protein BDL97_05G128900 [Sphagnum fallax]|nr:hypothetical protein BDL97_05G128900 [Sphagnum fallax]KAH8962982.1 hypothetical protein BDL97_05G128900 [Sphagnum fallax]
MATVPLSYKSILNLQRNNAFAVKNIGTADHDHLQLIIKDLGHPELEVRIKALEQLRVMLDTNMVDLSYYYNSTPHVTDALLRNLLEWFNLPVVSHEGLVISSLIKLAEDANARFHLVSLGALEFMVHLRAESCSSLVPMINTLIYILCQPSESTSSPNGSSCLLSSQVASPLDFGANFGTKSAGLRSPPPLTKDSSFSVSTEPFCFKQGLQDGQVEDGNLHDQYNTVHNHICHVQKCCCSRPDSSARSTCSRTRLSSNKKQSQGTNDECNSMGPSLPCVELDLVDDKYLFDINMTLQYCKDVADIKKTILELQEAVVIDFYPEAILQKYNILQSLLTLFQKNIDHALKLMALEFLYDLVHQLKAALHLASEAAFQVHPEMETKCCHKNNSHYGEGHPSCTGAADVKGSYPVYNAKLGALNPTSCCNVCGISTRSEVLVQAESDNLRSFVAEKRPVLSVGRTVHLIMLQLLVLLTDHQYHRITFPILRELLPLLQPPADHEGCLSEKVQVQYTQYFQSLCDALQAFGSDMHNLEVLICRRRRNNGNNKMADQENINMSSKAKQCIPLLNILGFAADLVSLLPATQDVAGLLPCPLVKAFTLLGGDAILGACNFGIHNQILLHLKFLDPDFYRTYCTAREAYSTLNGAAKALTAAKSAIAGWKNPVVPNKTMIPSSIINLEEGQQWLASMVKVVPFLLYTVEQAASLVAELMFVTLDLLEMGADDTQLQISQVSCSKIQQSPGFCQSPRSPRSPRRQRARKQESSAHLSPSLSSSSEAQISNLQASFNKLVHRVIRLGQMMLTSKAVCSSTISFLAIAYKESLLPLLAKGAGLAADPPHPLEAELPSPEQLDSTILRAIVSILSSAKKHKETHLLGQITTILTEKSCLLPTLLQKFVKCPTAPYSCCVLAVQCVSFVAKGLAIKMDDDPGFLPTNIFTPYKATEIAKDGCNQKISSPAQQPKSCSSFSPVDLRIEVHGMTIEFEDSERLTSVVTRSQQSSPNSCHQSSPPKIGLQDLVDGHGDHNSHCSKHCSCCREKQGAQAERELMRIVLPLLNHMSHLRNHNSFSLQHKQLVREILYCLWSITSSIDPSLWQELWASSSTSITCWLSQLIRDREAAIRAMAFGILTLLISPATPVTHEMLVNNWPDLEDVVVKTLISKQECYAVRQQALKFLIVAVVCIHPDFAAAAGTAYTTEGVLPHGSSSSSSSTCKLQSQPHHTFSIASALQDLDFWEAIPLLLVEQNMTPGFCRVVMELLLWMAMANPKYLKENIILAPVIFHGLMCHLECLSLFISSNGSHSRRNGPYSGGSKKMYASLWNIGEDQRSAHLPDAYVVIAQIARILEAVDSLQDPQSQTVIHDSVVIAGLFHAFCSAVGHEEEEEVMGFINLNK